MHVKLNKKICLNCGNEFTKQHGRSKKNWAGAKYCSPKCYWQSQKGKMPKNINILVNSPPWNKDKKTGLIPKSAYKSGEKHPRWNGGISVINEGQRKSYKYYLWRKKVLKRDNWTCVMCGYRNTKKEGRLVADHIRPFSLFPELRFDVDNGRTLCVDCDKIYGWKYGEEKTNE